MLQSNFISVVLCCHNSQDTIGFVFTALLTQLKTNEFEFEILLIDNNCTDKTVTIAEYLFRSYNSSIPLKIIKEPRIGLNYARSTGIRNSVGSIIVFCDDDNMFNQNYILNIFKLFNANHLLGCVGPGCIIPVDTKLNPLSSELRQFFQYKYLNNELLLGGPKHNWENLPAGTGMAIKADVAQTFSSYIENGIYKSKDRSGLIMSSGGDTQMVYLAIKLEYNIGLSSNLSLSHITVRHKLEKRYIKKMYFGVYSCHQAHLEAWPDFSSKFLNEKLVPTRIILFNHIFKYGHRSFKIGKLKHLISALANNYGQLQLRCKKDYLLDFLIFVLNLK